MARTKTQFTSLGHPLASCSRKTGHEKTKTTIQQRKQNYALYKELQQKNPSSGSSKRHIADLPTFLQETENLT